MADSFNMLGRAPIIRLFDPAQPVIDQLRGGTTIRALLKERVIGDLFDLYEPSGDTVLVPSTGILFCDLSIIIAPQNTQLIGQHSVLGKIPMILDVHFPFWDAGRISILKYDGNEEKIDYDRTEGAQRFFSDIGNVTYAKRLVYEADVVTTPHVSWARYLKLFNRNVVCLPDVHNADDAVIFCRKFVPLLGKAFINRVDLSLWRLLKLRLSHHIFNMYYLFVKESVLRTEVEKLTWRQYD